MTDPTAPVTPRTQAGRTPLRDPLENDPLQTLAGKALWGDLSVHGYDLQAYSQIRAIEREAGSTDALRAALEAFQRWAEVAVLMLGAAGHAEAQAFGYDRIEQARTALAASDAGPAGIDVELLAEAIRTTYLAPSASRDLDAENIAAEYARLSRESDR
jgi:hypothetical protein